MQIKLSPQRRDIVLTVSKAGDTLTINGQAFDFSVIPDGATLPGTAIDCEFVVGDVERIDGDLHITLILPHGPNPSPSIAFPALFVDPPDGDLELPQ
jgi:hypothetical protein